MTSLVPNDPEAARRIAERYQKPSRKGPLVVVIALLVLGLGGWTIWAGLQKAYPGVHGELYGYKVVSDTQTTVTIDVHRPDPAKTAACTVVAQAISGETVAELVVPVPPAENKDVRIEASLVTTLRAVTAVVRQCKLTN